MLIAVCQYKPDDNYSKDLKVAIIKDTGRGFVERIYKQLDGKLHKNPNEFRTAREFHQTMGNDFFLELKYD